MDWILDHLQIIIAVAGAIAYWLNARNKEKAGEQADHDGDGVPDSPLRRKSEPSHPAGRIPYDDNMRRIQEEIRRKIAERQSAAGGGTPAARPPSPPEQIPARETRREQQEARRAETEREETAMLERQRALAEQLAALKARKAGAYAESAALATVSVKTPDATAGDAGWLRELRGARSLRKAIVTREILGAPPGLR